MMNIYHSVIRCCDTQPHRIWRIPSNQSNLWEGRTFRLSRFLRCVHDMIGNGATYAIYRSSHKLVSGFEIVRIFQSNGSSGSSKTVVYWPGITPVLLFLNTFTIVHILVLVQFRSHHKSTPIRAALVASIQWENSSTMNRSFCARFPCTVGREKTIWELPRQCDDTIFRIGTISWHINEYAVKWPSYRPSWRYVCR